MKIINNLQYFYYRDLQQQRKLILLQQYNNYINSLFLLTQQNFRNRFALYLLNQTIQKVNSRNIIVQNYQNLLLQQINNYNNLINEGFIDWISDKTSNFVDKTKQLGNVALTKLKEGLEVCGDFFIDTAKAIKSGLQTVYNKCLQIADKCIDGIKKFGLAIWQWMKSVFDFFKEGYSLLGKATTGGKCGFSSPSECETQGNSLNQACFKTVPFVKPIVVAPAEKLQQKSNTDLAKLDKTLTEGGNADKDLSKLTSDVTSIVQSEGKGAESQMQSQAEAFNKELDQKSDIPLEKQQKQNAQTEKTSEKQITTQSNFYSHNLKEYFIDLAFKGITPKMLIEYKNGIHSTTPQKDIILENSKLSFKTYNGYLICEETNLNTKNKIIYETNCLFKGNHYIFEETKQKYINSNIIFQEYKEDTSKIISQSIPWLAIILWGGTLLSTVIAFKALWVPIHAAWLSATAGLGAPATAATQGVKTPVEATGGNVAGQAVSNIGKFGIKQAAKNIVKKPKALVDATKHVAKTIAKDPKVLGRTAKQLGKNAAKHPIQTIMNANYAKGTVDTVKDTSKLTIGKGINAKDIGVSPDQIKQFSDVIEF